MRRIWWVAFAALGGLAVSACGGEDVLFVPSAGSSTGAAGAAGTGHDAGGGVGGSGNAGGGGSAGAAAGGRPGQDAGFDATWPDAAVDRATTDGGPDGSPDAGQDGVFDAPEALPPEAAVDAPVPPKEAGADAADAPPDQRRGADAVAPPPGDAADGGLPPTCDYWIEPVPEATAPYTLCGTTSKLSSNTYQFSQLRFRQPFSAPTPIVAFASGAMTVRNGGASTAYSGKSWQATTGEEVVFHGEAGTADIVFTAGVQEISVTTVDVAGKRGCLPQPCTWTVAPP